MPPSTDGSYIVALQQFPELKYHPGRRSGEPPSADEFQAPAARAGERGHVAPHSSGCGFPRWVSGEGAAQGTVHVGCRCPAV